MAFAYGDAVFGYGYYSATKYVDAAATATASATASADSAFVVDASANTIQSVSSTASAADLIKDGEALVAASATTSSAAVRERIGEATSAASASGSASLQFLTNAEAHIAAAATTDSNCVRVRFGESLVDTLDPTSDTGVRALSNASLDGAITAVGATSIDAQAVVSINYIRRQVGEAHTIQGVSSFASVNGREKWEPIAPSSGSFWTIIAA